MKTLLKNLVGIGIFCWLSPLFLLSQSHLPDILPEPTSPAFTYYQNLGQIVDTRGNVRPEIKYYIKSSTQSVYLGEDTISFTGIRPDTSNVGLDTLYRLDMQFVCDQIPDLGQPESEGEYCGTIERYEKTQDILNYYLAHCPSGVTNVRGYQRIVYKDAFPKIDVHFYSNEAAPKLYFVVHPEGDPSDILLQFAGQDSIIPQLNGALDLFIEGKATSFPQAIAYTLDNSNQVGATSWLPTWQHIGDGKVNFHTEPYNTNHTLVIRVAVATLPTLPQATGNLDWSTYVGTGAGAQEIYQDVYVDDDDDVFAIMDTRAMAYPNFPGGEILQSSGNFDIMITHFDTGAQMEWNTFYGGGGTESGAAITGSVNGKIYLCGLTTSGNLPTFLSGPQSYTQTAFGGNVFDGFIASFNKQNGDRTWSTYFGGGGQDQAKAIALSDNPFDPKLVIAGTTTLSPSGTSNTCTADTNGTFPLCQDPANLSYFQSTIGGTEGFVAEFDLSTDQLVWSTYFGGELADVIEGVAIVPTSELMGGIYITGYTLTSKTPNDISSPLQGQTDGSFPLSDPIGPMDYTQSVLGGSSDGFIARFSLGHQLEWSTYIGGAGEDRLYSIAANAKGGLYLAGNTAGISNPTDSTCTANNNQTFPICNSNGTSYIRSTPGTNTDLILMQFGNSNRLLWSTFYGANNWIGDAPANQIAGAVDIEVDSEDKVYVTGGIVLNPSNTAVSLPSMNFGNFYYQPQHSSNNNMLEKGDAFLMAFDAQNVRQWATHFGGPSNFNSGHGTEYAQALAVYDKDRVYIVGATDGFLTPNECPASPNPYCQTTPAPQCAFISRFDISALSQTTGISPQASHEMLISPNPVKDMLTIEWGNHAISQIRIFDLQGRLIWEIQPSSLSQHKLQLSIQSWKAGVYGVQVLGQQGASTHQFIVLSD